VKASRARLAVALLAKLRGQRAETARHIREPRSVPVLSLSGTGMPDESAGTKTKRMRLSAADRLRTTSLLRSPNPNPHTHILARAPSRRRRQCPQCAHAISARTCQRKPSRRFSFGGTKLLRSSGLRCRRGMAGSEACRRIRMRVSQTTSSRRLAVGTT